MSRRPTVFVLDASVARTGALVGARNIARALEDTAAVVLILPENSVVAIGDLDVFDAVHLLSIANIRRDLLSIVLYIPKLLWSSLQIRRLMRRSDCHTLIQNDFYLMHGAVCRLLGFRGRVITWIRIDPRSFGRLLPGVWLHIGGRASDVIVAVSKYISDRLTNGHRAVVIYDTLDRPVTHALAPSAKPSRRLVFIGNYIRGKGQSLALEAFGQIACEFPDVELSFYGGDMGLTKNLEYKKGLETRARELGIAAQVQFNGFIDDPREVLRTAYLALNLSENESFSMTVLEASASGVPVVATRCGGPEEIIEAGKSGILVPVGDASATAEAVRTLLGNPLLADAMGAAGRERVISVFSAESFRDNLLNVLNIGR